ncbi:MAG: carbohydrate binding domain-containing protein [Litorimonas sp.]
MFKQIAISLSTAALLSLGTATIAQAEDEISPEVAAALKALDAQLPGTLINNPYDIEWNTEGSDKRDSVVKSEGVPGGMAYRVVVKKKKRNHWDTATRIPMTTSVEKDDVIMMSFWARAAKPPKGRETGDITVTIQRNIDPYDSVIEQRMDIGTEWKLYSLSGKASRDYSDDKTNINFNLAHAKQTIEFGQFYVMNLGKNADASKYIK